MLELHLARTFVAIVDDGSFTGAAAGLGISQPTVSQHVRRLERATGRRLFERDTHRVTLTPDGAVLERFAREMVALADQARAHYAGPAGPARVRLGVAEDLALTRLPALLRRLARNHAALEVDLSVGLTSMLYPKLDAGQLDLVLAKRRPGDERGVVVRREPLAWLAHRDFRLAGSARVPLVAYPSASITTAAAIDALDGAGRPWRMACSAHTLSGVLAGLRAALGVSAQIPDLAALAGGALQRVPDGAGLPPLGEVEFVLLGRSRHLKGALAAVADILAGGAPGHDEPVSAAGAGQDR